MNPLTDALAQIKNILVADSWVIANFESPSRDIYVYEKESPSEVTPSIELSADNETYDYGSNARWLDTIPVKVAIIQRVYDIAEASTGTTSGKLGIYELAYNIKKVLRSKANMEYSLTTPNCSVLISKPIRMDYISGSFEFKGRIFLLKVAVITLEMRIRELII